jgi:hypothetical protein
MRSPPAAPSTHWPSMKFFQSVFMLLASNQ